MKSHANMCLLTSFICQFLHVEVLGCFYINQGNYEAISLDISVVEVCTHWPLSYHESKYFTIKKEIKSIYNQGQEICTFLASIQNRIGKELVLEITEYRVLQIWTQRSILASYFFKIRLILSFTLSKFTRQWKSMN